MQIYICIPIGIGVHAHRACARACVCCAYTRACLYRCVWRVGCSLARGFVRVHRHMGMCVRRCALQHATAAPSSCALPLPAQCSSHTCRAACMRYGHPGASTELRRAVAQRSIRNKQNSPVACGKSFVGFSSCAITMLIPGE